MKAVILAGGLGTRLLPYTAKTPKPMLRVSGRPILEHTIRWLSKAKIRDVILCTSHMHEKIARHFGDGSKFGTHIEYAVTRRPLATAGQLRSASDLIDSTFVCAYGDSIFDYSLRAMMQQHARTRAAMTIATQRHTSHIPYGVINTSANGTVRSWVEKPRTDSDINVGCYILEPKILDLIPRARPFGMDAVAKKAISKRMKVKSYRIRGGFVDVGDVHTYEKMRKHGSLRGMRHV